MPTIPQEFRYAVRSLRRSPLVSCFIVATLAICIGAVAGGLMSHLMFGVRPGSPALLAVVSGILLVTALVASWVPGRRVARIDVLRTLAADCG